MKTNTGQKQKIRLGEYAFRGRNMITQRGKIMNVTQSQAQGGRADVTKP